MARFPALWFDGQSSRARDVQVQLLVRERALTLVLEESGVEVLALAHGSFDAPSVWHRTESNTQRQVTLDLRTHGSLQVAAAAWAQAWDAARVQARAQGAAGARVGLAERAQRSWATLLVATVVVLAALVAAYRWGTPWLAQQVARFVPLEVEQSLTRTALAELERRSFRASELDAQRRARLTARFDALTTSALADAALRPYDAYRPPYRLEFRSTSMPKLPGLRLGANALAFPGGLVVVTDDLVRLADERGLGDDAVVGVLAHEVGHVAHRHGTRMVIAQSVIGGFFGLALGDVSNILVTGAALLQGLSYSRAHELQADCFAVRLLARVGTPTAPMADLLEAMGRPEPTSPESRASAPVAAASAHLQGADAADWFSTHPATATRAANLRSGQVEGCAR